ncbi:CRAL-TRIO domain-containing protein [Aspergillus avenaceus]|uniref:CRAL-TRIO domain-containing protein n=1 Tax=Aspergillus avenaceus TaxID=36643 RepID=A0A5N6U2V1_ASPAV|nr:CRAL-TRIO domain-containing protein [Aspergillus avenaceus]
MSVTSAESGYVGHLTSEQEEKLSQLWAILIPSCDSNLYISGVTPAKQPTTPTSSKQRRLFSLGSSEEPSKSGSSGIPVNLSGELERMKMNAQGVKSIQQGLNKLRPDELRSAFFQMLKQEHPDTFLLRFLRAEDWDVSKGFLKLVSALEWRIKHMQVDEEVARKGELYALQQSQNVIDKAEKKDGEDFLAQLRTGKGYIHGVDKFGRPVCIVRARTHKPGAQSDKTLHAVIIHIIEQVRLLFVPPTETLTLVFDLTGFSLSNMEYSPVKFVVQCFQESYPESLGAMIFHNAPWFFSGIWKIIQGWLDPVVAAKVHFTNSVEDLEKIIDRTRIVKELGGDEEWNYEYVDPEPNENAKMDDASTRDSLLDERQRIGGEVFDTTSKWLAAKNKGNLSDASLQQDHRADIIMRLQESYWKLDPYVRSRTVLDRTGVIQDYGRIEFYPKSMDEDGGDEKSSMIEVERVGDEGLSPVPVAAA